MSELNRRRLLGGLAGGALMAGGLPAVPGGGVTALVRATLIDGSGAPPVRNATVVLAGDRILAAGRRPAPPGARVVDLAGRYLIPGLWDMHTHSADLERTFPPLHVVHGITGIREMAGTPAAHAVRRRIERGELLGPRMVIGSNLIDGPPGAWPGADVVTTDAEARAAVREARREHADFAKVYTYLSPGAYASVADEARRLGLPFAGHVPARVPVEQAVRLGQHTIEHLYGMYLSTSAQAADLYARLAAMPADPAHPDWWGRQWWRLERDAVATHSPRRAGKLFALMRRHGAWQSPTLVTLQRFRRAPDDLLNDPELRAPLRYMPAQVRLWWEEEVRARPPMTPDEPARWRAYFEAQLRLVKAMDEAGVDIVAGTDAGGAFIFPGIDLHAELGLLVRAGLSPARALRAATRDAARCAGLERASGTVAPGKYADLVVLDGDPLADIANTRRIHAVVCRGRYLGPGDRARVFAEVEAAAGTP
ncbi:amidohydrolase family protein [Nonomuraea endophytica]|uniref:Imidazolonepropionase-like amidohydrolase n=1 Tax=Nonomuraea endophytica TaxID=714136 RepID=A0A7W8A2N6_9ACTN|nr:amidohydrolase family protein [Nonomuraea endophytica]MBB5078359.1 imidazolonepropionase-like amidohydrolase [Nonomuraea endophytica]